MLLTSLFGVSVLCHICIVYSAVYKLNVSSGGLITLIREERAVFSACFSAIIKFYSCFCCFYSKEVHLPLGAFSSLCYFIVAPIEPFI